MHFFIRARFNFLATGSKDALYATVLDALQLETKPNGEPGYRIFTTKPPATSVWPVVLRMDVIAGSTGDRISITAVLPTPEELKS